MVHSILARPFIEDNVYNGLKKSWSFDEDYSFFIDNLNECLAYELVEDEVMKSNKDQNNDNIPTETTASYTSETTASYTSETEVYALSPTCSVISDDLNNFNDDWFMSDVSFINDDFEIASVFTLDNDIVFDNNNNDSICVAQPCTPFQQFYHHQINQNDKSKLNDIINVNDTIGLNEQSNFNENEVKKTTLITCIKDEDIDIKKNIESLTNQIKILNDALHKHESALFYSNIKNLGVENYLKKEKNIIKYHSGNEMSEKLKINRLSSISKYLDKKNHRNWLKYKPDAVNRRNAARNRQRTNGQFLKRKISWVTLDQFNQEKIV